LPRTLGGEYAGLVSGRPYAIILLGRLLLMATPFLRVAVSVVTFVGGGDWRYAVVTAIVLALLVLSFVLGRAL